MRVHLKFLFIVDILCHGNRLASINENYLKYIVFKTPHISTYQWRTYMVASLHHLNRIGDQ